MNKRLRLTLGSAALVAALITAGCSGGASPDDDGPAATPGDDTAAAERAAAQAVVDEATQPVAGFTAPGPAFDTSGIQGGTVYYVIPALEAAVFQTYAEELEESFRPFDIGIQQCGTNGGSPDGIANCLQQAVDSGASAVIALGIPYVLSPTGFDKVGEAGIPVLYGLTGSDGEGEPERVAYFSPNFFELQAWNAQWVIADSGASANVLVIEETDNPAVQAWTLQGSMPAYENGCSACVVKKITASTAQLDKLTTDVTAALVANPDIAYVQTPAGAYVSAIIAGLQGAGKSPNEVNVGSMDMNLAELNQLQQSQWLTNVGGTDFGASAWYMTDQVLRMLAGEPSLRGVEFPYQRLFTRDNTADLESSEAAWKSGAWFGSTDYREGFTELWGR